MTLREKAADSAVNTDQPPASSADGSQTPPSLRTGVVRAFATDRQACIDIGGEARIYAQQATSCVVAPIIGDTVLVHTMGQDAHILAILDRADSQSAALAVPNVRTLTIEAPDSVAIRAPAVKILAGSLNVIADVINQIGDTLSVTMKNLFSSAVNHLTSAKVMAIKSNVRSADIAEADTLNTKTLSQNIDGAATQRAEINLITASQDVRIDAERVNIG